MRGISVARVFSCGLPSRIQSICQFQWLSLGEHNAMEDLLMSSYDENDHHATTLQAAALRLYTPDAGILGYSILAEKGEELGKTQEWSPAPIWDVVLGQLETFQGEAFWLCHLNRIIDAVEVMLEFLRWMVTDPIRHGILYDDAAFHPMQLRLFYELNISFLAICQKQKDLAQVSIKTNTPLPDTCLNISQIEKFGVELIEICDTIEKHGLVDYEIGVWEEEILSVLGHCWSLSAALSRKLLVFH